MIHPTEKAEKMRQAPSNTRIWTRQMNSERRAVHLKKALHHEDGAGLSSTDEFVFLKQKEVDGK